MGQAEEALKNGTKQGEAWADVSKGALAKWKSLEMSGAEGKTVEEQVRLAVDIINVVNKQVQAISERASAANSNGTGFDMDPYWKAEAESHRTKMEAINRAIVEDQTKFAAVMDRLKTLLVQIQDLHKMDLTLNTQTPSNASQVADAQMFYGSMVSSLLTKLLASYSTLSRAYSYHLRTEAKPFDTSPVRDALYLLHMRQLEALASDGKVVPVVTVSVGACQQL